VRRALYLYVAAQPGPVSRDAAAAGAQVPRHVAKFHLDRLEEDGLLAAEFKRPPGKSGPGAGRPTKLYHRSSQEFAISLPERRYDVAGWLMARAITRSEREAIPVAKALVDAASETGRLLGEAARHRSEDSSVAGKALEEVSELLGDYGYEPRIEDGGLTLENCPFHALAQDYTELVCGMNLNFLCGLLEGVENADLEARLDPAPGRCCVTLRKR
jgi:predicted ArsR family transcriptional regulator